MTGTGAAVRAWTAPGPCETPVPGARARVDGKQDALDAAGRSPGDVVIAEWAVHDDDNEVVRSTCVTLVVMTRLRECGTGAGRCRQISAGWLDAAAPSCDVSARVWRCGVAAVPRRRWHEAAWSSLRSGPPTDWDHMAAQSRIGEAGWTGIAGVSLICASLCPTERQQRAQRRNERHSRQTGRAASLPTPMSTMPSHALRSSQGHDVCSIVRRADHE
jgi:hypothetical protein